MVHLSADKLQAFELLGQKIVLWLDVQKTRRDRGLLINKIKVTNAVYGD
ncbi:hypothetical protein [Chroogloeocystis siderophila]|nr:hypothetical protein [Chroogloeocystis siderophila]